MSGGRHPPQDRLLSRRYVRPMNESDQPQVNLLASLERLVQDLYALETALAGRLSAGEMDLLSSIQQTAQTLHTHWRLWIEREGEGVPVSASLAHAQTLAYAHDLVQTYRQSVENRRRLELTAQQLIRAEKLATIGRVAASVAHELGNIVTPLLMYTNLLEGAATGQSPEIVELAGQIRQTTQRARTMVEQLAASAQSDAGHTLPTDLAQVIDGVLELLAPRFKKGGVSLRYEIAPDLPLTAARPGQLEQVFTNVIINALEAMPGGGQFTISLGLEPMAGNGEQALCIRFADTGEGIPADRISQVFDPFYTTKSGGAGSGLGLFVSHLIVDQHGGTIELDSLLGEGTTVSIYLPVAGNGNPARA
jgi:two-component system NtrC family sensor kinase